MKWADVPVWTLQLRPELSEQEADAWCQEHFEEGAWWSLGGEYQFDNKDDHLLFLLAWG